MTETRPYFVEKDINGCSKCEHGTYWTIVDPDGTALGSSWGDREFVDDLCEMLNDAFEQGRNSE